MKLKKVTLEVIVKEEFADSVSKEMERSHLAQEGVYTLNCGGVSDLTKEELEEVESQVPIEYLED